MNVQLSKKASKVLDRMDRFTQQRIRAALKGLEKEPPEGDIVTMQGYSDGRQRLRVGKYRIVYIYTLETGTKGLYIMEIGARGDIYK